MTDCIQSSFGFEACGKREIVARFDGGTISSDGGALLLRQTDQRLNLLPRLAERPGGYTRIIHKGPRLGDAAPMVIIELVD
jgi:hypothetical protein